MPAGNGKWVDIMEKGKYIKDPSVAKDLLPNEKGDMVSVQTSIIVTTLDNEKQLLQQAKNDIDKHQKIIDQINNLEAATKPSEIVDT